MVDEGFALAVQVCLPKRDPNDSRLFGPFSDDGANDLKSQLEACPELKEWADCPRTFGVLYMAGFPIDMIQGLQPESFNDYYLPYRDLDLRVEGIDEEQKRRIISKQSLFLSEIQSMAADNFLRDPVKRHRHIRNGDVFFSLEREIRRSSTAVVAEVRHRSTGRMFAAKKLFRGKNLRQQKLLWRYFHTERNILRQLRHQHIVQCIGTFTDETHFTLILHPLAELDLERVLDSNDPDLSTRYANNLRNAFGCLANAIAYLHSMKIRHKDIKPGNILLKGDSTFLCDFGTSLDWYFTL